MAEFRLVYLATGRRAHHVKKGGRVCVRCGTRPRPWEQWFGTASHVQRQVAAAMPLCVETIKPKGDSK